MTAEEALICALKGEKITHPDFANHRYIHWYDGWFCYDNNIVVSITCIIPDGWHLYVEDHLKEFLDGVKLL